MHTCKSRQGSKTMLAHEEEQHRHCRPLILVCVMPRMNATCVVQRECAKQACYTSVRTNAICVHMCHELPCVNPICMNAVLCTCVTDPAAGIKGLSVIQHERCQHSPRGMHIKHRLTHPHVYAYLPNCKQNTQYNDIDIYTHTYTQLVVKPTSSMSPMCRPPPPPARTAPPTGAAVLSVDSTLSSSARAPGLSVSAMPAPVEERDCKKKQVMREARVGHRAVPCAAMLVLARVKLHGSCKWWCARTHGETGITSYHKGAQVRACSRRGFSLATGYKRRIWVAVQPCSTASKQERVLAI